jgi:hypothetical protein
VAPDQIYQPVSDEDDQSETPPAGGSTELPIESWSDYKRSLEESVDKSDLTTEEAANTRRRQPDAESPESAHERPITVHRVKGGGELSLNEAADNIHYSRGLKLGQELRGAGFSEAQLDEMSSGALERAQRLDPKIPPPPEVKGLDEYGRVDDGPISVDEAANQLTDWRQRHAEAQQAELQEMIGEAEAAQRAQAQQAQPEPAEPQQQQPQAPDPVQTERAQIAKERAWVTHLARMSGQEAALRNDLSQLGEAIYQEFPSLRNGPPNPAEVEHLRQTDPARHQKLMMADQMVRERQQKIAAVTQQRQGQEAQQARINAQARAAARAEQDRAFEQLASQHIPGWDRNHGQIRQQARTTLEAAGLSQAEIHHLWNSDDTIDAHSSALQLILAKAASWDMAQQKAQQARQANVPQVQKPGTYRAPDGGEQSVRDLQMRLNRASGREALRLATELTKARRASGG